MHLCETWGAKYWSQALIELKKPQSKKVCLLDISAATFPKAMFHTCGTIGHRLEANIKVKNAVSKIIDEMIDKMYIKILGEANTQEDYLAMM